MKNLREVAEGIIRTPIQRLAKERMEYYPKPAIYGVDYTIPFERVENKEENKKHGRKED